MEPSTQYSKEQSLSTPNQVAKMNGVPYNEAIGSILWPAVMSRPDIAYAVGILLQFMQNPGPVHWEGVKQIINYLNTTKNYSLTFGGTSKKLIEGFCDADWASLALNIRVYFLPGNWSDNMELQKATYHHVVEHQI